jgi:2,3-dihydroxybenzoate-AMP ligase
MSVDTWNGRLIGYPPQTARRYRDQGLWGHSTVAQEFHAVAERFPEREALATAEGRLTFAELDRRSDEVALGLHELGLRPGDPVLFQVVNRPHTIVAWYGCLKAGLVPVATLAAHRMHEISEIGRRTGAVAHLVEADTPDFDLVQFAREHRDGSNSVTHVLTVGASAPSEGTVRLEDLGVGADAAVARRHVDDLQAGLDIDGVVVFQLSGGTTGVPKVIPRLHAEYWYNAVAYAERLGWDETSRVAHLIPIIHNAGIIMGVHGPHSVGACLVLGTPNAQQSLPLMVAEKTTDVLIGHGHYRMMEDGGTVALAGSLRRVILSGAKVPPDLFEQIEGHGMWSGQLFGMSEGFCAVTTLDADRTARLTTVGTPLSEADEFRILEPGSEVDLPDGTTGELCCRGPYTLRGYFDAADHNKVAFTSDGFYRTGDLATVHTYAGQRCISIDGRIKDVISRGGEKINAEEVELLLLDHPAVRQAAVVAMPDPRLGERTCAFLIADGSPVSLDQLREHLAALGVAKFKWPERIEWVGELPRSNIGKLDKKTLRRWAAEFTLEAESSPLTSTLGA